MSANRSPEERRATRQPSEKQRAVGQRLRALRKAQGLTAMEVAIALGCTQQNYEFYELGRNTIGLDRLREFAAALRMNDPHSLHDALYPVEDAVARRSNDRPDQAASSQGFELPGRITEKVTMSRNHAPRPRHPSIGAPLRQLATAP